MILFLLPTLAFSDVIELKNGKIFEGEIVKKNKHWIEVKGTDEKLKNYYLSEDIKNINGKAFLTSPKTKKASHHRLSLFKKTKQKKISNKNVILHLKKGDSLKGRLLKKSKYYISIMPNGQNYASEILWDNIITMEEFIDNPSTDKVKKGQDAIAIKTDPREIADIHVQELAYKDTVHDLKDSERKAVCESYGLNKAQEEQMYKKHIEEKSKKNSVLTVLERDNPQTDFEISGEVSNIVYEEKGIMRQKGKMVGVNAALTYRLSKEARDKKNMHVWANKEKFTVVRLEGRLSWGDVDYDSYLSGALDDLHDYMIEFRGALGYELPVNESFLLTPYAGVGYRYLNNDFQGITTTNNWGYERESRYIYLPLGIEASLKMKKSWQIILTAEYDYFLDGTQKSHLENGGLSIQDSGSGLWYVQDMVVNDQDEGYGLRGSLKVMKMTKHMDFFIEPYIRYWRIKESDPKQITSNGGTILWWQDSGLTIPVNGYEPKNTSIEYGIKIGARF